jgi:gas vesicle protein
MGQDPSAIRSEIEQTREEMGDTVEALAYKADVKTRAKENVSGKVDSIKEKVTGAGGRVSDATPDADQVKGQAKQAVGVAQENPLGLAVGAVAVGFVAGLLVPVSKAEERKLAPVAGDLRERVTETAQTAVEHGKAVAQEAAQSAAETVKEQGPEHAQQVKEQAQASAS